MKKLSILTLIASGIAGTAFADVSAYRQDSGSYVNSYYKTYVGNEIWGAGSETIGKDYLKDTGFLGIGTWDDSKKAFLLYDDGKFKEYYSFDTVFALTGDAKFTNAEGKKLTFSYTGNKEKWESDYDGSTGSETYGINNENIILLAGNSKFSNNGIITTERNFVSENSPGGTPPNFYVFLRDAAVFENSGQMANSGNYEGSLSNFDLFDTSKLINNGTMGFLNLSLYDNASFENKDKRTAGASGFELDLANNAKIINSGTLGGEMMSKGRVWIYNSLDSEWKASDTSFVNKGTVYLSPNSGIEFEFSYGDGFGAIAPKKVNAVFENYGTIWISSWGSEAQTISVDCYNGSCGDFNGGDAELNALKATLAQSTLQFKNYGTINGPLEVSSYVDVLLAEGSTIVGMLSIGSVDKISTDDWGKTVDIQAETSKLTIELNGKGGDALVAGNIELNNSVSLDIVFAEDAPQARRYKVSLWQEGLSLTGPGSFSNTTGVVGNYTWELDPKTGLLSVKDMNIGEEVTITDSSQSVNLGEKDVAEFDSTLSEFCGALSGRGEVHSSGALAFSGNAAEYTGTLFIDSGNVDVSESAELGSFAVVVEGELALSGNRTLGVETSGNGSIHVKDGASVLFEKAVGVKALTVSRDATLRGNVRMTHSGDAELLLEGTLSLDLEEGEKVSLGGGTAKLANTAKLDIGKNEAESKRAYASQGSTIFEGGNLVTIFENGTVMGDVLAFLESCTYLQAYKNNYSVIYDTSEGLSVRVLTETKSLISKVDTSGFDSEFVDWALSNADDKLADLKPGFVNINNLSSLVEGTDPLLDAIFSGNTKTARGILERLSPKSYAAMVAMPTEAFYGDIRSISSRLEQRRYDGFSEGERVEFFAQAQVNSVENDKGADAASFDFDMQGMLAGVDYKFDETAIAGLALGMEYGDADIHSGGGKIEASDFRLTGYLGKTIEECFFVNTGVQFGYGMYDVKRKTDYGQIDGDTTGWSLGAFADAGTVLTISQENGLYAMPYVGLAYVHTRVSSFSESGSHAAFDADAISGDSLRARIGCGFSWGLDLGGWTTRVGLDLMYSHDFMGDELDVDVMAADGTTFSENAKAMPEDEFSVNPTINFDLNPSLGIYAGYTFAMGTDSFIRHSANLGFRMRY